MVFEDEAQQTMLCTATELARLLVDHFSLRLVVLNACLGAKADAGDTLTSTSSVLVRRGVPAVVAMQHEIGDQAAVEFARSFYTALANWKPVDESVAEARKAVSFALRDSNRMGHARPAYALAGRRAVPARGSATATSAAGIGGVPTPAGADSCATFEGAKVLLDRIDPGQFTDPGFGHVHRLLEDTC